MVAPSLLVEAKMTQLQFLFASALIVLTLLFLVFVLQYSDEATIPQPQVYRGYYYEGLEAANFYSCDHSESWWITYKYPYLSREYRRLTGIHSAEADDIKPIYTEVRGELSGPGRYGGLGLAQHSLRIREVIATNHVYTSDRQCKPAAPHWPIVAFEYEQ